MEQLAQNESQPESFGQLSNPEPVFSPGVLSETATEKIDPVKQRKKLLAERESQQRAELQRILMEKQQQEQWRRQEEEQRRRRQEFQSRRN